MLFNSYEFILLFLPVSVLGYFLLSRSNAQTGKWWLFLASLFFYGYWNYKYVPLILSSIAVNYGVATIMQGSNRKRAWLIAGVTFNLVLLGYFKYVDFFIENLNRALSTDFNLTYIALPLAISFFTFQQISFLVDTYQDKVREKGLVNYLLFVTFFTQLIAGPIVHHAEMMPQFADQTKKRFNWNNVAKGVFIFIIGLSKKVIIADTFAVWATKGFDVATHLNLAEGWVTSLSYSLQLYFDFSGYTDMAIGGALLFNIELPLNFNSPYKALDIQDFWRRWHMTLSRFLRDYLYIPLGGNRNGTMQLYRNLFITFLLGGLWHGAAWTFVFWGALHGLAIIAHRIWKSAGLQMPKWLAWFITFNFVNIAFVFFRAKHWADATKVLKGMAGLTGVTLPHALEAKLPMLQQWGVHFGQMLYDISGSMFTLVWLALFFIMAVLFKNSNALGDDFNPNMRTAFVAITIGFVAFLYLNRVSEFLYFQF